MSLNLDYALWFRLKGAIHKNHHTEEEFLPEAIKPTIDDFLSRYVSEGMARKAIMGSGTFCHKI